MKTIQSFTVNHDKLQKGVYVSRRDGDITTFDLRFIKPNTPPFLDQKALHTIEHLMATYARNSRYTDHVVYFGPMGCRTGFYFLTRGLSDEEALALIKETVRQSAVHEGDIPGNSKIECGNYLEHDLPLALKYLKEYDTVIRDKTVADLQYEE